jgi:hypothetical protein
VPTLRSTRVTCPQRFTVTDPLFPLAPQRSAIVADRHFCTLIARREGPGLLVQARCGADLVQAVAH